MCEAPLKLGGYFSHARFLLSCVDYKPTNDEGKRLCCSLGREQTDATASSTMAPKRKAAKAKAVATAKEAEPPVIDNAVGEGKPPASKKAKVVPETLPSKKGRGRPSKEAANKGTKDAGNVVEGKSEKVIVDGAKKGKGRPSKIKLSEFHSKSDAVTAVSSKVVIVEASKECSSFKVRAAKVESDLKETVPGIEIKINPEKPRKGCFEIRDGDGTIFLSLLNMPRPYTKMKNLDLDKVIKEIAEKVK